MKLDDDLLMQSVSQQRRVVTCAFYSAYLWAGTNLVCRSIKSSTIRKYLLEISKFYHQFLALDIRKHDQLSSRLAPQIVGVLSEMERWEAVPNRREPYTLEMQVSLEALTVAPNSLLDALADWFGNGLLGGYRLTEWAQESGFSDPNSPLQNFKGQTRAFCLPDLEFRLARNRKISHAEVFALGESCSMGTIEFAMVTYKTQKNGNHGEMRKYKKNQYKHARCPIRYWVRIFFRFVRLAGWRDDVPLSVYRADDGATRLITAAEIETTMRKLASITYNIAPASPELTKWSAHSLRVGACCLLQAAGFSHSQIQWLLRWRSMAFIMYLRNMAILSDRQNKALSDLGDEMPNYL
jgi:hypothetical protein